MGSATDDLDEAGTDEAAGAEAVQTRLGTLIAGSYRIIRHLGSGGSSHVFEAEHVRLGKSFAIKLLRPEMGRSKKTAQRFRREAKAIAGLQNEHIISVVDCGELPDQTPYLIMELLEGEDLRSLLQRERQLPARRAVRIIVEACRGLSTVHEAGLVHRDLKPENLFIARRSAGHDWCKVLDFGVAKMDTSLSTAQGTIVGTVRYMAPEQLASSTSVGPATDVYALAAILYECLTGRPLHEGESVQEVMYSVMNRDPRPLAALRPELPKTLIEVVDKGTAKDASARPQSTAELARSLLSSIAKQPVSSADATWAEDDGPAAPEPSNAPSVESRASPKWPLAAGCIFFAGLILGWLADQNHAPREPTTLARTKNAGVAAATVLSPPSRPPESVAVVAITPTSVVSSVSAAATGALPARKPVVQKTSAGSSAARVPATPPSRFDQANPYGE